MDGLPPPPDVTRLLREMDAGSEQARSELLTAVYQQLRGIAAARMAAEGSRRTLQATELVHEAWLRLGGPDGGGLGWANRRHFFGAAALAMRRILIEHARRRDCAKRGGNRPVQAIGNVLDLAEEAAPEAVLALDEALAGLERESPDAHQVVMLRFFAGLPVEDCAAALDCSPRTVLRQWAFARAWLARALEDPA